LAATRKGPERLTGTVERGMVRKGTGSEHNAVILCTDHGERLILQRIGGNPFDDAETRGLDGQRISVEGFRLGNIFRYTRTGPPDESSS
jgi:hypothetical protein